MDRLSSDQIVQMLTLSEEITMLNYKLKQLVEDLGNTQNVLGSLKNHADNLNQKVGQLKQSVNGYKPPVEEEEIGATPSNSDGIGERERIVPTPENYQKYMGEAQIQAIKQADEERKTVIQENRAPERPPMPERDPVKVAEDKKRRSVKTPTGKPIPPKRKIGKTATRKKGGFFKSNKNG